MRGVFGKARRKCLLVCEVVNRYSDRDRIFYLASNRIPVFLDISNKSSTTGLISGIPFFLLIASASRSGSPGISGPLVPGAGFGLAEDMNPVVDVFFELVFVDEVVDLKRAEED